MTNAAEKHQGRNLSLFTCLYDQRAGNATKTNSLLHNKKSQGPREPASNRFRLKRAIILHLIFRNLRSAHPRHFGLWLWRIWLWRSILALPITFRVIRRGFLYL
jgi:hypothetical protein